MTSSIARRGAALVAAALLLAGGAAACSDDDDGAGAGQTTEAAGDGGTADGGGDETPERTAPEDYPEPEVFEGTVEAFYEVPDPLPPGNPGDLIRVQELTPDGDDPGLRIMYHSTDARGIDRAVTGVLYHPPGEPPEGGWPVVATAHGTTGIAPQCAPSRVPHVPDTWDIEGVRVATDYIGLGPVGERHAYLSATAEGNAVIDSVVAAQQVEAAGAGDEWLAVGHSQGGHAAMVTNEMAPERLPDAELLGTVAIAPGAQFTEVYGDQVQINIITAIVLAGAPDEHPDIDIADYLAPDAAAAAEQVTADSCLGDIIATMAPFAASDDFYANEPLEDPETREWMESNDPGQAASPSPLLMISGDLDTTVMPARVHAAFDRQCENGQVVDLIDLPNGDHGNEPALARDQVVDWLAARLAGEEAPNGCDGADEG